MADNRMIKTTIELAGEGTYKDKLNQIKKSLDNLKSEQAVVNSQFDKNDKSLAALAAQYGVLQSKLDLHKAKLAAIKEEYEKVAEAQGKDSDAAQKLYRDMNYAVANVNKSQKALTELGRAIEEGANAAEEAEEATEGLSDAAEEAIESQIELADAVEKATESLEKAEKITEDQKKALSELGKQAEKAADKMSKVLTAATVSAVTYSGKEFMDFESEMSNVATLADTTAVSMDELSRQALAASNATGVAATEIAQGAYTALSSGVDTANAMNYITEASKAAKAGQSDLNTVVSGSTSIMNAWKISYSDATSVFEKMLVAQDKGKTTLGELSSQIGQITGLAPQLNISLDETLAAVAALTKSGVQTSSAITGLRAVMSNVLKPTSEAAEAAEALGLEFNAAALQSKGLTGFLADVMDKTGGSSEELAKLFGSVEGLSQIMLLGGSAAEDYADALAAMSGSAGRLDEAFSTVTDNSAARLSMSLNKLKNNAIEFGQTLAPYIDLASDSLAKLSEKIGALSEDEQKSLLQTALWVAGGLKAVSMISKITGAVRMLGTAATPVGATLAAVTALAAGITMINKAIEASSLDTAWDRLSEKASANIEGNMNAIINASVDTSNAEDALLTSIQGIYSNVAEKLTDGKADTPEVVNTLKEDIASLFATANERLEGLGDEAGEYADQLKTLEAATVAWVDSMAGRSTEYVQQHLDELNEIQAAVEEVIAKIDEGNASLRSEGRDAYKLAQAGATTNQQTIAEGAAWAYRNRELDLQAIKEDAAAQLAEADQAWADGLINTSQHRQSEEAIAAWQEQKISETEQLFADRMTALTNGVAEAFADKEPETVEAIKNIVEKQNMIDALNEQMDVIAGAVNYVDVSGPLGAVQDLYDQIFGGGEKNATLYGEQGIKDTIKKLENEIKQELASISVEDNGLIDTYLELFSTDIGDTMNVDTENLQEVFKAALGDVGAAGIEGLKLGLEDGDDEVRGAATAAGQGAIDAAKDVLKIHSPSREFYAIGQYTIQGMIDGAASKQAALTAKMRSIAKAAANAVRAELDIHSPSHVMEEIGEQTFDGYIVGLNNKLDAVERTMRGAVSADKIKTTSAQAAAQTVQSAKQTTINVQYSGAFTRREAQRFGREFALQIASEKAGKGG